MIKRTTIVTPIGEMTAAATREGLCLLDYSGSRRTESEIEDIVRLLNMPVEDGNNRHLRALRKQLKDYFKGKLREFTVPLIIPGTPFQQAVWNDLLKIPYGATVSYLHQATMLKKPGAVRAVASANGSNRIAIVIPCHRVIGSDGSLTGYGGGLEKKRWLIDHEKKYSGQPFNGTLF